MAHNLYSKRVDRGSVQKSSNKMILCKCPRCEKEHKKFLHWTGRGRPRIYCRFCLNHYTVEMGDIYHKEPDLRHMVIDE